MILNELDTNAVSIKGSGIFPISWSMCANVSGCTELAQKCVKTCLKMFYRSHVKLWKYFHMECVLFSSCSDYR